MNINEWHDFFVATAGSAAALTGLIFVGVSINIERILSIAKLPDRALLSLILLLTILIISTLILIPQQSDFLVGLEVLFVATCTCIRVTKMDVAIYKKTDITYKRQYLFSIIFNQLSVFPYLVAGITILVCGEKGIYWIVPGIIFSFIKAVIDAWVLLVEINR